MNRAGQVTHKLVISEAQTQEGCEEFLLREVNSDQNKMSGNEKQ